MEPFLVHLNGRLNTIRDVSSQVKVPMSEVVRRIIDHSMNETTLNVLFPAQSGHIHVTREV